MNSPKIDVIKEKGCGVQIRLGDNLDSVQIAWNHDEKTAVEQAKALLQRVIADLEEIPYESAA